MLTRSVHSQLATQTESRWTTGSPNVLRESATWAASTDIVVRREAGVAALGSAARMAAAYFSATMYVSRLFLLPIWGFYKMFLLWRNFILTVPFSSRIPTRLTFGVATWLATFTTLPQSVVRNGMMAWLFP